MNTSVFYKNEQSENEKSPTIKRLEEMPDPEEWFSNEKSTKIIETSKEKQDLEDKVKKMEEYIKQLEAKKKSEEENVKSFIPVVRKRNILKNEQTETKPGVVNLEDGEDGMPAFLKGVEQILTGLGVDYCAIPEGIKKHVVNDDDTDAIVNKKCLIQRVEVIKYGRPKFFSTFKF